MPSRWNVTLADETPPAAAPAPVEESPAPAVSNRFHALMIVEDTWTGDNRFFA
jgi:hypothetical protein